MRLIHVLTFVSMLCSPCMSMDVSAAPPPEVDSGVPLQDLMSIMERVEEGMLSVPPCENSPDAYFAAAVMPHREGAVELCNWLVEHGSHPQLLSLCGATIASTLEVQANQLLPDLPACIPPPAPAPASPYFLSARAKATGKVSNNPVVAMKASMEMDARAPMNGNPDHDYAIQMAAHHWAAINMARVEMLHGSSQPLKALASQIIVSLTWQTEEFREILQSQYNTII